MTTPNGGGAGGLPRLNAARAAATRGWPVFPLYPYVKRPAVDDWEHRATCQDDVLAAWWAAAAYNVGIACGPARLVVIDLDQAHGHPPPPPWNDRGVRHGRDVLDFLARQAGEAASTRTYTVATPTGGEHRYFLAPDGVDLRNTAGSLGWRVDTRAGGGFIVAAGSARRVNGRVRFYTVIDSRPPAPLPDWLTTALAPAPASPAARIRLELPAGRLDAYTRAAVDGEVDNVTAATPGARNLTLFKAAANLGELVGAGVLDETIAAEELRRAAQVHHGVDGFTAAEAERTISSGLARGRQHPRRITEPIT